LSKNIMTNTNVPTNSELETTTMIKWIIKAGASTLADLKLTTAPVPQPGIGQVRVKIKAASINYRDQIVLTGAYGAVTTDLIPLSDGSGVIDALGEGVTQWNLGDRVTTVYAAEEWADGPPIPGLTFGLGAEGMDGVLAEYVVLSAKRVTLAPSNLSFIEAATLPCAGLTAWTALNGDRPYVKRLKKGDRVMTLGTGGVSLFALILAKAIGAEVAATSSNEEKLQKLIDLGAVDTINYITVDNWGDAIFEKAGGFDKVINAVGGSATDQSIAAVGYGGEIASMGMFDLGGKPLNYLSLMMKGASIRGTAVGSHAAHRDLVEFIEQKDIKPPVDKIFSFENAKEAYEAATSRDLFGKVVIEIGT
jgi:NADPH:quinone reductase-like Zn-dependent oxidoreductase